MLYFVIAGVVTSVQTEHALGSETEHTTALPTETNLQREVRVLRTEVRWLPELLRDRVI